MNTDGDNASAWDGPDVLRRRAARVLLVDHAERVLLFRGGDPARPEVTFWFTPGGGVEPGESLESCAVRELQEETGLNDAVLGPLVWHREARFFFEGQAVVNDEVFYLVRCEPFEIDTAGFTEPERRATVESRWWEVAALPAAADAGELFAPADLPVRLVELLTHGAPAEPVRMAGATAP